MKNNGPHAKSGAPGKSKEHPISEPKEAAPPKESDNDKELDEALNEGLSEDKDQAHTSNYSNQELSDEDLNEQSKNYSTKERSEFGSGAQAKKKPDTDKDIENYMKK